MLHGGVIGFLAGAAVVALVRSFVRWYGMARYLRSPMRMDSKERREMLIRQGEL
jgi:hypothetical protein